MSHLRSPPNYCCVQYLDNSRGQGLLIWLQFNTTNFWCRQTSNHWMDGHTPSCLVISLWDVGCQERIREWVAWINWNRLELELHALTQPGHSHVLLGMPGSIQEKDVSLYKTYTTRVLETETNNKKNWYKYKLTKKWILTVIKAKWAAFYWWYKMVLKAVIKLNSHFCCTCSPRRLLHTGLVAVVFQSLAFWSSGGCSSWGTRDRQSTFYLCIFCVCSQEWRWKVEKSFLGPGSGTRNRLYLVL